MADKKNALRHLVETVKKANEASVEDPPIEITPEKYGFKTEKEYWAYIRKAAKKAAEELTPPG
jgi:hypothetical protein